MALTLLLSVIVVTSLLRVSTSSPIDAHLTAKTTHLFDVLYNINSNTSQIMVGKQDPYMYGVYGGHAPYWTYDYQGQKSGWMFHSSMAHDNFRNLLCDPCALTHDVPAVVGFEIQWSVGTDQEDALVYLVRNAHDKGAIVTFSYHAKNYITGHSPWISGDSGAFHSILRILPGGDHHNDFLSDLDRIANFINTRLTDSNGQHIPIIFRPWHEANGGWFWWGQNNAAQNTPDHLKRLYQTTVTYLRDTKGLHNILYAFSPDCGGADVDLYPGNEYVDIIGTDCYMLPHRTVDFFKNAMEKTMQQASNNGKIAALSETGVIQEELTNHPHFFTQEVLNSINTAPSSLKMAYMLTWANQIHGANDYSVYDPYPGHPMAQEYMNFYNDPKTFFVSDLKANYQWLYQ